jgi:pyridoxal phosphate enzyme (YggS family)
VCAADGLQHNLALVRWRIQAACQRAGRPGSAVTLVGVTKGVTVEAIRNAAALGLADVGENRVQEAHAKQLALGARLQAPGNGAGLEPGAVSLQPVRWHLIGHLQRNKAKLAATLFDVIHSVDSLPLIEELDRQTARLAQGSGAGREGARAQRPLEVCIQVNVSGEATKFGCRPEEAASLAQAAAHAPRLKLAGLMTIAPFTEDPERVRPHFRRLRQIRDALGLGDLKLSMGMSQDFEVAIEEGADLVRIGTAIFGPRGPEETRDAGCP